ncbi:hypothetical protein BJF78_03630 [Pseudonocardia sp. CNS-139]|nr:hypothetical protein BJF78_03630 [Pseudonocardia sp. CNS-139]
MTSGAGTTGTGSGRTRAVDELASLLRPAGRAVRRKLPEIVAGFAVLVTALAVFAVAGAALNDRAIAANPAIAQAEVLDGSTFFRTLVRFTVANGEAVVPAAGVFYPRGLQVGQSVAVEYDVTTRTSSASPAAAPSTRRCRCSAGWRSCGRRCSRWRCGCAAAGRPHRPPSRPVATTRAARTSRRATAASGHCPPT